MTMGSVKNDYLTILTSILTRTILTRAKKIFFKIFEVEILAPRGCGERELLYMKREGRHLVSMAP